METKLWASPALKKEYELMLGSGFEIEYGLCVNKFLQQKLTSTHIKYQLLRSVLSDNNIEVFYGDDKNYFHSLYDWIKK
jgi:hypothetical protein